MAYLLLKKDIEEQIIKDKKQHWASPYAFKDENVIRREINVHDIATLIRPAFSRDIEKIINIPAYNRYANKTQVFSFLKNDDICRRGLHVQLVSKIARAIGEILGLNLHLIEAIALGHDLGHTPFGHAGERYLSQCYHAHTGLHFSHNLQSVRVMDALYNRNISLQTLDGALCHNGEFAYKRLKLGQVHTFENLDDQIQQCTQDDSKLTRLRPSTLEGCVVRVADMIAYLGKDRSDALTIHIIPSLDIFDANYIGTSNSEIIHNMSVDIINNSYRKPYIAMSEEAYQDLIVAKRQNFEYIYLKEGTVSEVENIIEEMFNETYERLLTDIETGNEQSAIFRHHIQVLARNSKSITQDEYLKTEKNQIIVDYISSMTDSYFIELYNHLFPHRSQGIFMRGYFHDLPR